MRRFVGIKPFDYSRREFFFGRETDVQRLEWEVVNNRVVVLHGIDGAGKTSLILAGLSHVLEQKGNFHLVYSSLQTVSANGLIDSIRKEILPDPSIVTYLDKVAQDNGSLWFALKKWQAHNTDRSLVIVVDEPGQLLSDPKQVKSFLTQVSEALYSQVPLNIKNQIDTALESNPGLLTDEGYRMLYSDVKVSFLFVLESGQLSALLMNKGLLSGLGESVLELEPLSPQQAKGVLVKTCTLEHSKLQTSPFTLDQQVVGNIIDFLQGLCDGHILPAHLQLIGVGLEKLSDRHKRITLEHIGEVKDLFLDFYLSVFHGLDEADMLNLRRLVEDDMVFGPERRLIPVFEQTAMSRYQLQEKHIDLLISSGIIKRQQSTDGHSYLVLSSKALIDLILLARDQRLQYELYLEQELKKKRELEKLATQQQRRYQISRRWLAITMSLLLLVTVLTMFLFLQRKRAIRNQNLARSSLYSVLAFQNLDRDPTHAIRLAQKAFNIMPDNPWAWSALLSAFYRTGLFYQTPDTLDFPYTWARVDPTTSRVLAIYTAQQKSIVYLYKKPIFRQIDNRAVQNFALFLPDSGFVTGGWDSTLHFYNPDGTKTNDLKLGGIIWSAALSTGKRLAVGLSTGQIVVLDSNYTVYKTITAGKYDIWSLAFSRTGLLAASSQDNVIKIFDKDFRLIRQIPVYKTFDYQYFYIAPLGFSSDGQYIAAALNDFANDYYVVRVWTIDGHELVNTRMAGQWINDMRFLPDKDVIITASKDGEIRWFDIKTGQVKRFLGHSQSVLSTAYSPQARELVSISMDRTVRKWKIKPYPGEQLSRLSGYSGFAFSGDGASICVWNGQGAEAFDLTLNSLGRFAPSHGQVLSVRSTDRGFMIFTSDNQIFLWDPLEGKTHSYSLGFQPVDALLADTTLIISQSRSVLVPRSRLFRKAKTLKFEDQVLSLNLVGNKLCVATVNGISVYNGHRLRGLFVGQGVRKAIFGQKYIYVLTASGNLNIFDYHFRLVRTLAFPMPVLDLDVSHDERLILLGHNAELMLITPEGNKIYEYSTTAQVQMFAFNPNSKFFVVLVFDGKTTYLKHWVCSPHEVVNYIDNIHYFGHLAQFIPERAMEPGE